MLLRYSCDWKCLECKHDFCSKVWGFLARIEHGSLKDAHLFLGRKLDAKMDGNFDVFPL